MSGEPYGAFVPETPRQCLSIARGERSLEWAVFPLSHGRININFNFCRPGFSPGPNSFASATWRNLGTNPAQSLWGFAGTTGFPEVSAPLTPGTCADPAMQGRAGQVSPRQFSRLRHRTNWRARRADFRRVRCRGSAGRREVQSGGNRKRDSGRKAA